MEVSSGETIDAHWGDDVV